MENAIAILDLVANFVNRMYVKIIVMIKGYVWKDNVDAMMVLWEK